MDGASEPRNGYWFSVVEVEVNSRCNRACSYCPVSVLPIPDVPRYMSDEVFERIVSELERQDYSGKFSFHFYNEPLIRKDLERLVEKVARRLPRAYRLLYTNGDLLTDERHASLLAAGLDHILVTSHSGELVKDREKQTVQYPDDLVLTSRAGLVQVGLNRELPMARPCWAPSDMLIVTVTGDVVLCCEDATRAMKMGNVMEKSLAELWFSPDFVRLRTLLQQGKRGEAGRACARCDNMEFHSPGENYQKVFSREQQQPAPARRLTEEKESVLTHDR
ncbi:MAG TPA: SPASM domain-containing protein [Polyangiaceae bacterium]|nr:SPASM domain-containing protein [Polyangiaceae bacterium]